MEPKNQRIEVEDLAKRLHELYKRYEYEHELPVHDDLVAKLEQMKPRRREAIQSSLDQGMMYPIDSYEKAEKIMDEGNMGNRELQKIVRDEIVSKFPDNQNVLKKYFVPTREKKQPTEKQIIEFMEFTYNLAREYFEVFKEEVKRYLTDV